MIGLAAANAFEGESGWASIALAIRMRRTCPMRAARYFAAPRTIFQKLQRAWSLIRERGPGGTYVLTGLEHSLPLAAEELEFADDEIAPALSIERLKELALDHLGGSPETDDVAVFNRLTGATMATHLTLVKPGDRSYARR
jgi:hypothetical protein